MTATLEEMTTSETEMTTSEEEMLTSEEVITRLYRVQRTLMQMLNDRGYTVFDNELNMSKHQFIDKYGNFLKRDALALRKTRRNNYSDQIFVFFPEGDIGKGTIEKYREIMEEENVRRTILVVHTKLNSFAKKYICEIFSEFHFEVFQETELLVNVTEHVLVPKHQLLTNEEKKTVLEKYTALKETDLPRIQMTDPIARYYGMMPGQVVKITRPSETAGRYITYRYVV